MRLLARTLIALGGVGLTAVGFSGCRGSDDLDPKERIEWTCVRIHKGSAPIASIECMDQLRREQSPALKLYTPIPQTGEDGKIQQYVLLEKGGARQTDGVVK